MFREGPSAVKMNKMDSKGSLKINKEGVEVENTGNNFENLKGDVKLRSGKWYYEAKLLTYGQMRIGWCTDKCTIQTNTYTGIGNDNESWGFDGSCQRAWFGTNSSNDRYGEYWANGDIIGTVLDLESKTISFYRNGKDMGVAFSNIQIGDGVYPAASLHKKQKLLFNFGKEPFKYPLMEVFPDIHPIHLSLTDSQIKELTQLFEKYKAVGVSLGESGDNEDVIKGQGLLQFGQDLGIVDDKDPGLLIISWKLNVNHEKCWEITRDEFIGGFSIHGCHNVASIKKKLEAWRGQLKNAQKFKSFYNYVFDYLKEDKKILSLEEAVTVWDMLGMHQRWPLMGNWVTYLQDKKAISRDTWRLFFNFIEQYPTNLDAYDADGCWPSLIDEFVDHMTKPKDKKK
eukprot:TRINITY_DN370_c0_g1_i1.p1 TRINITY_DN370_c0_g1~~TRINITY_DN370_c0_g1_i1.p1  ORF type:complete len:398 (-),score=125.38 TRINITY_DN370_c0_g1_i1:26-1219(-)